MEKIESKEIKVEEKIHKFYCDNCNEFIMASYECDDGWWEEPEPIELKVSIFDKRYIFSSGIYCDECKKYIKSDIEKTLKDLGYKED